MNSSYGSQNNSISGFQKVVSVPIDDVRPGMVCAQSIEDRLGRHLVNSGAVLNQYVIDRLKVFGILYLDIRFSGPNRTAVPKRSISPEVRETIQRERRPDRPKVRLDRQIKTQIEKGMELIYTDSRPDVLVGVSSKISDDLMNAIGKNDAVALNLVELKTSDEYTFNHSVDVATIAMVIAKNMHYPPEKIREIGVAGILHDVGKSKVPIEILNKPARLTNDEFDHEKINGRGYPNGLTEDEIEPYAKILTVADIYDALCTTRPYKKGYTPRESVEMLAAMTDQLDIDVLNVFFSSMVLYPVDSTVRLSNGEEARVVRSNDELITRPVVVGMKSGKVYDLSSTDYLNLVIAS